MSAKLVVAVVAPGDMGSGVGQRLGQFGAIVRTSLHGRSAASGERAKAAGLSIVDTDDELVRDADFVLSIVPAAEAPAVAKRIAPALERATKKPLYVDCNAVSGETLREIGETIAPTGSGFIDVGIFGRAPSGDPATPGPIFYASGPHAAEFERLGAFGLRVQRLEGPVGAASMMKLIHTGITKGLTAVWVTMSLCAARYGLDEAVIEQWTRGHPDVAPWLMGQVPRMFPRAYRWVAEMDEISGILERDTSESALYSDLARIYDRLAKASAAKDADFQTLSRIVEFSEGVAERHGRPKK